MRTRRTPYDRVVDTGVQRRIKFKDACRNNRIDVVYRMRPHMQFLGLTDGLWQATLAGHHLIIRYLLKHITSRYKEEMDNFNMLLYMNTAVADGYVTVVQTYLAAGIRPHGTTFLRACESGSVEMLKLVHSTSDCLVSYCPESALKEACECGENCVEMTRYLLDTFGDIMRRHVKDVMHSACEHHTLPLIDLLERYADEQALKVALQSSIWAGHLDLCRRFITPERITVDCMMAACAKGFDEIIDELIARGCNYFKSGLWSALNWG